jgi:hypothetical protein
VDVPTSLDSRLTDGGEIVSLMRRPHLILRKIPGTHFCWRLYRQQGHSEVCLYLKQDVSEI